MQFWPSSCRVKGLIAGPSVAYGLAYKAVVIQATFMSFTDCFRWLAYTALLATPAVLLFKGSRHMKSLKDIEDGVTTETSMGIETVEPIE